MTPEEFVQKWEPVTLRERASAMEHFGDLCRMLGQPTPIEADPTGERYTFEKRVSKVAGGNGFADVWKKGHFGWEYKGPGKNLDDAYRQLLLYREDLDNPPLLIVSDIQRILIHTNFTGTTKKIYEVTLPELVEPAKLRVVEQAFTNPQALNPKAQREQITEDATKRIGQIALRLRERGHDAEPVAHFLMQLVFALFAEDIALLPNRLVTRILERTGSSPDRAQLYLGQLLEAMAGGGEALLEEVPRFNGGLFEGGGALRLEREELQYLHQAAELDWSEVEPAIFGTLFERSLDPERRGQLGAHYTSRDDILRIVNPVILDPLWEEWFAIRKRAEAHLEQGEHEHAATASRQRRERVDEPIARFLHRLQTLRVLDPACGSGNFLYVAMQQLKDLEKEVVTFAQGVGAPGYLAVSPEQFHGIELNVFARELTSMVVWIGYLQWNRANGESNRDEPILRKLGNIVLHDALMNEDGTEYGWPGVDFIIGNPPFLGGKRMRTELSDGYVDRLFQVFDSRVAREADLVTYWFEKARAEIEVDRTQRAGLLATNSIRGGANRRVLQRIKDTGDIFMAWSDEPWVLDGAAVRVSIIGFDDGSETKKHLDGALASTINPDLTRHADLSQASRLAANAGIAFMGTTKGGPFDIEGDLARSWLALPNPSGRSNADVVRPWVNGMDLVRRPRNMWIVDFGLRDEDEAQECVVPFEYVRQHVKPNRMKNKREAYRRRWWLHMEPRPALRDAMERLPRYVATPRVAKHRIFVWLDPAVLPDSATIALAIDDDFGFGVLHSVVHELWSLRMGSWLGKGNDPRYTPTTCFETFPFPRPDNDQRQEVAAWAKHLDQVRNQLLDADPNWTMTRLYNRLDELREDRDSTSRTYPLLVAHERLDAAVAAAYGWEWPLDENEILTRLLALNLERAAAEEQTES